MVKFPKSLIQIHYHNRKGGVKKVIEGYAHAFREITKEKLPNILICNETDFGVSEWVKIVNVPECDYIDCTDINEFNKLKNILVRKISNVFKLNEIKYSALVIGHNLNLCKNPSLSAAFTELARQNKNFSFYSVMHDFVEEGRIDLLEKIFVLEKKGIAIKDELYHKNAPVSIVVPGNSALKIFTNCGFKTKKLNNPIFIKNRKKEILEIKRIKRYLKNYAQQKDLLIDLNKPVYSYPVRIIPRKNILEALALVTVVNSGNLLTGIYGRSSRDRSVFCYANMLVEKFRLPVIFNVFKIIEEVCKDLDPVEQIYKISDFVVSTSVAEGFGYAMYEPWFFECMITGRIPEGLEFPSNVDTSTFYNRFPIPADWISIKSLREKYMIKYGKYYKKQYISNFLNKIIVNDTVDFGILDEKMQFDFLEKILKDEKMKLIWRDFLNKSLPGWPGLNVLRSPDCENFSKSRKKMQSEYSISNFQELFYYCFTHPTERNFPISDYSCILKEFSKKGLWLVV